MKDKNRKCKLQTDTVGLEEIKTILHHVFKLLGKGKKII